MGNVPKADHGLTPRFICKVLLVVLLWDHGNIRLLVVCGKVILNTPNDLGVTMLHPHKATVDSMLPVVSELFEAHLPNGRNFHSVGVVGDRLHDAGRMFALKSQIHVGHAARRAAAVVAGHGWRMNVVVDDST